MAVMLRSLGIPSRVVNGFHGGEFNRITGEYIVRARDAHSWVEAYFPGQGWITFDPTPAGAGGANSLSRIALYLDALSSFWRDWVVSYDTGQQLALGKTAVQTSRDKLEAVRRWSKRQYRGLVMWAEQIQRSLSGAPSNSPTSRSFAKWERTGSAALLLAFLVAGWLGWSHARRRITERDPPQAAAISYKQMTKTLARRGYRKNATQTASDFALCIADGPLRELVSEFTNTYLAARFGSSAADAQRLPDLLQSIKHSARA
jgi:hypothetical protein